MAISTGEIMIVLAVFGLIGGLVGTNKAIGGGGGLLLGVLLGPLGILIAAVSEAKAEPTTLQRIQARPETEGWHPDPLGRFDGRYYNGTEWTQHVGRIEPDGTRRTLEDLP